jgi:hypothetical protein
MGQFIVISKTPGPMSHAGASVCVLRGGFGNRLTVGIWRSTVGVKAMAFMSPCSLKIVESRYLFERGMNNDNYTFPVRRPGVHLDHPKITR